MGWLVRWRLALRMARRDALRHRGRTLLVLAMVGLPVLAVVAADTFYRTHGVSSVEALPATLGAADARLSGETHGPVYADPVTGTVTRFSEAGQRFTPWTRAEVTAVLPPGSRMAEAITGSIAYRTRYGYASVTGRADDLRDPLRAGAYAVLSGRMPAAGGEVAVSQAVARGGVGVGDRLALTRGNVPATVVGVLDSLTAAGDRYLVLPPSAARLLDQPTSEFYADVPGGLAWPAVHALNQQGLVVVSREVVTNPPPPAEYNPPGEEHSAGSSATTAVLALIVASVVIEVVLLAGPAFAVGVRRQRRDLALLAATGGAPADLRRVVLASGLVLGGGAAVLGGLLGIGLVRAAMLPIARWTTLAMGPFDVAALDVALTVAVGVLAGVAAAYVPARQAARTDIVATLTDRRGQIRTSWRSPLLGLLLATVGLVAVVLGARGNKFGVAVGAVVLVLGVVAATPWLVGLLAPLANRLPVAGRLAVRDATRNRSRTAPAIAAVMATVAGVTALAIASTSDSAKSQRDYLPSAPLGAATVSGTLTTQEWADITALLARRLPGRALARVQSPAMTGDQPETLAISRPGCSGHGQDCNWWPAGGPTLIPQSGGNVVVIDPAAARALYPPTVAVAVADGLERGRVVVLGPGALDGQGRVRLTALRFQGSGPGTEVGSVTLPAAEIPVPTRLAAVPSLVVVPPALLDRLPVPVATSQLVAGGAATPITATQEAQLREAVAGITPNAYVQVERGWIDTQALLRQILFALGAVLVLIATFTATGLTLTDARPDFATLAAVGAAPSTRRRMAMGTAAVIGISGALLGVLVGLAPGIAVAIPLTTTGYGAGGTSGGGTVIVLPWATLAGVTLLVPLLAVAITGLVVHSRLPMTRRTS